MKKSGALAIFVKTPGLSPVKTRLAQTIGAQATLDFYELSLVATAAVASEVARRFGDIDIYWAVAEQKAHEDMKWGKFPTIWQGEGLLGDRLSRVYDSLLTRYQFVSFIGADSPHVLVDDLVTALIKVKSGTAFVLGETDDGGFYFFGGSTRVLKESWTSVEYSCSTTSSQLSHKLRPIAPISYVNKSFDIDTLNDLKKYAGVNSVELLPEQSALIDWSKTICGSHLPKAKPYV